MSKKILIHSIVFSPDGVSTAYLYNDIALKFKEEGHLMHGQMNYTNIQLSVQGIKEKNNIDLNEFELSQSASPMVHFKDYSEALGVR